MEDLQYTLSGILTGVLLLTFIGICVWSWSAKRKNAFDYMASLPLEQDSTSIRINKEKSEASS